MNTTRFRVGAVEGVGGHGEFRTVEERGFGIFADVMPMQELVGVGAEILGQNVKRGRAGVRHAMRNPAVAALARHGSMMEIARAVLGGQPVPFRATLFEKSQEANWLVAWHQDTTLPLKEKRETPGWGPWSVKDGVTYSHAPANALERVVALRVHLDDSTAENGPLRVLPGTHRIGVLSDTEIHELARRGAPVECCVGRGGVVAMRPLVVHASSKSRSDAARRVLHVEYACSAQIDGLELALV